MIDLGECPERRFSDERFEAGMMQDANEFLDVCAKLNEANAEIERLRYALERITEMHLPDQPAASGVGERTYAMQHIGRIRRVAMEALGAGEPN